jgi:hypothetical protein
MCDFLAPSSVANLYSILPLASVLPALVQAGFLSARRQRACFLYGESERPVRAVWSRYEVPEIDFLVYSWNHFLSRDEVVPVCR